MMVSVLLFGLFTITANADTEYYSGYTGDCRWVQSGKTLTISGSGAMADYITTSHPWSTSITEVIIGDGVTRIGQYAFNNCTKLTTVDIPNNVTSIGYGAFTGCTSLSTLDIPDSVTSIGNGAFDNTAYYNDSSNWTSNFLYIGKHLIDTKAYVYSSRIKEGTLTIADYAFYHGGNYITSITIPDSVTHIGELAFVNCYELTSVTLGSGVKSIGYRAFNSCSKLTDVYYNGSKDDKKNISIKDGNSYLTGALWHHAKGDILEYTFDDDDLTAAVSGCMLDAVNVNIPSTVVKNGKTYTVTSIARAFYECTELTSVTIPDSVTSIGEWAFYGCTKLTSITIPDSVTSIGDYAFRNTAYYNDDSNWENNALYIGNHLIKVNTTVSGVYSIKRGTVNIASSAFGSCSKLTSIIIPDSVTSIGASAFSYCSGLTSAAIPDSVTSIGASAFSNCTSLALFTIPDSVTSIGNDAFYNTALYNKSSNWQNGGLYIGKHFIEAKTTISGAFSIKEGTLTIATFAFDSCEKLTSITIPDSVTVIGGSAFYKCTGLTTVTIPDSVTSIGGSVFYYCTGLTSVAIPDSVMSIGRCAFEFCESLTSITIPDSVTNIGDYAFRYCEKLVSVILGKGVTCIGDYLFYYCHSLTSIAVPNNVTDIGEWAFTDCTSLTSITIGNSVKNIGYAAFYRCTSLTSVSYGGTEEHWSEISFGTGNDSLLNANVTYAKQHPKPATPTLAYEGGGMVVLDSVDGCEYSLDGINWQSSNIFTNLKENTEYTFYCRVAMSDGVLASDPSDGLTVTTSYFYTTPATPSAPTVQSVTATTVTLVAVDGHEYSMDGVTWQSSNAFEYLSPVTEYTFYCRVAETNKSYASEKSAATVVTTIKLTISAPAQPKLAYEGDGMIILNNASGCEYSRDGVNWQTGNIFEGLRPNKTYTFYCRIPETDTTYVAVSEGLTVTTSKFAFVPSGDTNGDGALSAADAVYLMNHVIFGNTDYHINKDCDFDGDGYVTSDDATYLLYHILFGEEYPLI